jgi:hypothetical protein
MGQHALQPDNSTRVGQGFSDSVARSTGTASPREVSMAARSIVLCVVAAVLTISPSWASDAIDAVSPIAGVGDATGREVVASGNPLVHLEPRIDVRMSDNNRERLVSSFQIAVDRVQEVPECGEMFARLGADGTDTITKIFFTPIGKREAKANICNGSVAYTFVGSGPTTWLCRDFSRLTDKNAAKIIIHEALHHAGLTERPKDPKGMTSTAINKMVSKRCGL